MFAETDAFWKWPSVYDVLTVGGLALGIASIWYAGYLARRQLRADFDKAATEAVDVLSRLTLGSELSEAVRFLKDAERFLAEKKWEAALLRLDDAASAVARFCEHRRLTEEERGRLTILVDQVREVSHATRVHAKSKSNRGHLPEERLKLFGTMLTELERLRGRLVTTAASGGKRNS